MSSSLKLWIPLALVTGWAVGHGTSRMTGAEPPASEPSPRTLEQLDARLEALPAQVAMLQAQTRCVASVTSGSLDLATVRTELRTVLREELSAMAGRPEPTKVSLPAPSPEEVSPKNQAVLERGQRLLDDALRARRWGDAQVEELRGLFPGLTFAQQRMLTQKLIVSINRGDLIVETTGLPF
jgi:hypothetical protein